MWSQRLTTLSKVDRDKAIQLRNGGLTQTAIAKRLGVSGATVSRMLAKAEDKTSAESS